MKKQLQKKGYEKEEVEKVLNILIEKSYLDDRRYTFLYFSSEVIRKGKPLFVIRQRLQQKGVDRSILEDIIEELEEELVAGMKKKLEKEISRMKEKEVDEKKIIQRLQARGYGYKEIKESILIE